MVTTIKQGATKKSIDQILNNLTKNLKSKGLDAYAFVGKIKLKNDALKIQKDLRNEWQ